MANGVTHITADSKGNLWLATYQGGIDYFDKKNGTFTHYNQSNVKGLGSDYNWYVMHDTDEKIYIAHVSHYSLNPWCSNDQMVTISLNLNA